MISHVSSRPNWYSTHAVCNNFFVLFFKNCYYFSDLEIQWSQNSELKSSSLQFTGNFMAPMGSLKIKTGLPTSPTCQRALITHGQLTVIDHQIPAFAPDWSFSAKLCQIVIIVYWHNCLRANLKQYLQRWLVNKPLQQPISLFTFFAWCLLKESWSSGNHW